MPGGALPIDWCGLPSLLTFALALQFEADRRAFIITINSFGTELSKEDRAKLFPHCGRLYPEGLAQLARADDYEQVKNVADYYPVSALADKIRWPCGQSSTQHSYLCFFPFPARNTNCFLRVQVAILETRPWRTDSLNMR